MNSREEKDKPLRSYPRDDLESPFLEEDLFVRESEEEWQPRVAALAAGSPFLQLNPQALEEEIIGQDERTLVADTIKAPNQWICAIDILIDNPKWGGGTNQPQFIAKSRATGILIGPRYVLTARHILDKQSIEVGGEKKLVDVKGLTVSPARNGSNSNNPFGKVKSKAVRVSQPYFIQRNVRQGFRVISIPIQQRDDYALIILEKDVASSTHSKLKGPLGYWGQNPTAAVVGRLEPDNIQGRAIVVIGYPGDTCGKDRFSGSKSDKDTKIANCWNRRNVEWASTQWRGMGTLQVEANTTTIFHTVDTYEGQSGAPICLSVDQKLLLVGIHTGSDDPRRNRGVRVTRRMLGELCAWMNADAGYQIATIKDDTLIVQPKSTTEADAKEFFDFVGDESQTDEQLLEERFDPTAVPKDVADALAKQDWPLALKLAILAGWRDENDLTNLIFFARHPELPTEPLKPDDPNFKQLSAEWTKINYEEVWKAIEASAGNTDLVVSGKEVSDHHRSFFRGKSGKTLKKLVEDAAREVDLNPGLLAAIMMAETRRPLSYFSSDKVKSYHIGVDDFYEGGAAIKARVPAYAKVKWDKIQKPVEHDNDSVFCKKKAEAKAAGDKTAYDKYSKLCRKVKTIWFDSGPDGVLATAVYVKFREVRLREKAAELGGNFDSLPLPTRLALTRMAMGAGTAGATPYLMDALKGVDIFVRQAIPVRAYQTQRNATVRTAQAMHLSDWVFGIKVEPASLPKVKELEDLDEALESRYDFDSDFEEVEAAEGWEEEQESLYDVGPELEAESGEDWEDLEFEDKWAEKELDDDEQPVIR